MTDARTQQSRGTAFVRFDRREEAEEAIKGLNGYQIPGSFDSLVSFFYVAFFGIRNTGKDLKPSLYPEIKFFNVKTLKQIFIIKEFVQPKMSLNREFLIWKERGRG